jgi:MFS family permease
VPPPTGSAPPSALPGSIVPEPPEHRAPGDEATGVAEASRQPMLPSPEQPEPGDDGMDGTRMPRRGVARSPEHWAPGDRSQLAVVTFSHAVQHFYPAALAVAYPFVVSAFHVSYGVLGLVVGVAGVAGGLLQAVAGLFERVSARLLLAVQNLGLAASTAIGAAAPAFWVFGLARLAGAAVSWPQHPVGSAVLTERFPRRRALVLSWHVAGGSVGTAVIPLIAAALIAAWGWRVGLGAIAVPLALGGLLVAWRLEDPRARRAARQPASHSAEPLGGDVPSGAQSGQATMADPAPSAHTTARRPRASTSLRVVLRRREALGALVAGTIAAGGRGLGTLTTYVPAYLKSSLHLSTIAIGAVFTVMLVGSVAGPVAIGHLADRLGRRKVLVATYVVAAVFMVAFVHVGAGLVVLAAVGLAVGVFAYAESPLLQAVFSERVRGVSDQAAFGVYFAVAYGVGSLWVTAVGYVVDAAGFAVAFALMAASFLAAALLVALTEPRAPAEPAAAT